MSRAAGTATPKTCDPTDRLTVVMTPSDISTTPAVVESPAMDTPPTPTDRPDISRPGEPLSQPVDDAQTGRSRC